MKRREKIMTYTVMRRVTLDLRLVIQDTRVDTLTSQVVDRGKVSLISDQVNGRVQEDKEVHDHFHFLLVALVHKAHLALVWMISSPTFLGMILVVVSLVVSVVPPGLNLGLSLAPAVPPRALGP
uniref:Uncharacterized protein n=1 Tax=Rhizophora mucronata TaxID=61149 RepID=A0A2P2J8C7_RHIMU